MQEHPASLWAASWGVPGSVAANCRFLAGRTCSCLTAASPGTDGLCLDLGHLVRYHQTDLLEPALLSQTAMVHWNLTDATGRHLPLTAMGQKHEGLFSHVMEHVATNWLHVLEIFDWEGVAASLPIVRDLWRRVHGLLA